MRNRSFLPNWSACYLASGVLALVAIGSLAYPAHAVASWVLTLVAAGTGFVGYRIQRIESDQNSALVNSQAEVEILRVQLQEQTRAIDSLADGLDVAILICDLAGNVIYANLRACDMFRFEQPVGRSVLAMTLSYDLEQLVLKAVEAGAPQTKEIVFPYPDERVGIGKAWIGEDGQRVFLSVYEVTHLRRLERVRQDFVANVSHELRTPMSIIRAYAETLLDDDPPDPETASRYLPRIIEEVDRLSGITQDLLVLSTAESNVTDKQRCDIAEIFSSVVTQLKRKAEDRGLDLAYRGPAHRIIKADPSQMTQVALNLVDNALNYTPKGSVDVFLEEISDTEVQIRVKDSGIGIASEHLPRIFERFYRVDKGRSRSTGGTGLGLSIVKHIVEAHEGSVSVSSSLNIGSEFKVVLPIGSVQTPVTEA